MNKGIIISTSFLIVTFVTFPLLIIYRENIVFIMQDLLIGCGKEWAYIILFFVATIGSTIIPLPIALISIVAIIIGLDVYITSIAIGLGAAIGSCSTYILGKYFSHVKWVSKILHRDEEKLSKAKCKLAKYGSFVLFSIAISPLPGDAYYLACGLLEFPLKLYIPVMIVARITRYMIINIIAKGVIS